MTSETRIYRFSQTICDWAPSVDHAGDPATKKKVLGGKGAALVDMCLMGLNVPPGFTITTDVCNDYRKQAVADTAYAEVFLGKLMTEVMQNMEWLSGEFGFTPLVSVRSGAPVSMPGMMDTILNVGLCSATIEAWEEKIGVRAAWDSYRRLIQMLGATAYGVPHEAFEKELADAKKKLGVSSDSELTPVALTHLVKRYKQVFQAAAQQEFPDDPVDQLRAAIRAVFNSWLNERAVEYRKINKISDSMGTAVNVQAMVFGNMGSDSGSGVLFTRDPSTGENVIMGEYLADAQGEDVVAGIRTPDKLNLKDADPDPTVNLWKLDLIATCERLEAAYKDMVDVEFTVQKGKLYVLQSRSGKRSAIAAIKIAHDLVSEGVIDRATALKRVTREQFKIARRPNIDPSYDEPPTFVGLPACPGVAKGVPAFSSDEACASKEDCILVSHETTPEDIAGMAKAVGILTQTGGATSHAAVVARAMDKPCITGAEDLMLHGDHASVVGKDVAFDKGTVITIDGGTGRVWIGKDVPVVSAADSPAFQEMMTWCLEASDLAEMCFLVPDDASRPFRITAYEWWGDETTLDLVLDDLQELEDRSQATLDLASPKTLRHDTDAGLEDAFGVDPHDGKFADYLYQELVDRDGLKGLTLVNLPWTDAKVIDRLRKKGYVVTDRPRTVADLMQKHVGEPDSDFIENVVGGTDAWVKLKAVLLNAGHEMRVVQRAVPPEYAAFATLASAK